MKKLTLTLILIFKLTFANQVFEGSCLDAKLNSENFISASIGRILTISRLRISIEMQNAKLEKLLTECTDVVKISKRVLGRTKWNALNENEQENFLKQYPIYFVSVFREITLQTMNGVDSFSFKSGKVENTFDVSLKFFDTTKKDIIFTLRVEENNGHLKITDGEFLDISIVNSQRDMFDRLYNENQNNIKNFNAKQFFKQ